MKQLKRVSLAGMIVVLHLVDALTTSVTNLIEMAPFIL